MLKLLNRIRATGGVFRVAFLAVVTAATLLVYGVSSAQAGVIIDYGIHDATSYDSLHNLKDSYEEFAAFPQSNGLAAVGSSYSFIDYAYTQLSGVTTLAWSVSQYQDGSSGAYAQDYSDFFLTATTNQSYTWTASWNGLNTLGSPSYNAYLYNLTVGSYVFHDFGNVANHSGSLIAGHQYEFGSDNSVKEGGLGLGESYATGNFNFTATEAVAAVPEPASLTIFGLGAFGFIAGAVRPPRESSTLVLHSYNK